MDLKNCSFCKAQESEINPLIAGNDVYICKNCVISAYKILFGDIPDKESGKKDGEEEVLDLSKVLSPKELKSVLDEYVIGQERAKKIFSVAVYNHYKRLYSNSLTTQEDDTDIEKSNILLIGPTGSGKTLMAQTLARFLNVPIAISDATSLTEAGYVGEDVENVLVKLIQAADGDIKKAQRGIVFIDEVDKISRLSENRSITRDVSGEGVQQALLKIIEGSVVNIPPKGGRKHPNQEFTQMDTKNILFICGGAFDGLSEIIRRREGANVLGFSHEKKSKREDIDIIKDVEADDLVSFGLIPELVGRLHVVTTLEELSDEALLDILTKPKNAIIKQYKKLFAIDSAKLTFSDDALKEVVSIAKKRKTGARGLRAILEDIMLDVMFDLPEYNGYEVVINKECVQKKEDPMLLKYKKNSSKKIA
ncbi:MAG: ATP-dependent Clp protease ATP-binding subunit ClpX [Campylobacterales bacterium]